MLTAQFCMQPGSISITDIQARLLHHSATAKPYVTFQLGSRKVRGLSVLTCQGCVQEVEWCILGMHNCKCPCIRCIPKPVFPKLSTAPLAGCGPCIPSCVDAS